MPDSPAAPPDDLLDEVEQAKQDAKRRAQAAADDIKAQRDAASKKIADEAQKAADAAKEAGVPDPLVDLAKKKVDDKLARSDKKAADEKQAADDAIQKASRDADILLQAARDPEAAAEKVLENEKKKLAGDAAKKQATGEDIAKTIEDLGLKLIGNPVEGIEKIIDTTRKNVNKKIDNVIKKIVAVEKAIETILAVAIFNPEMLKDLVKDLASLKKTLADLFAILGIAFPAARLGDLHVCPVITVLVPHVGGPIIPPCSMNVVIGKKPAARILDKATCIGPPDIIVKGSTKVMINKLPAARILDMTAHGGVIVLGEFTVLLGG